jgi:hypothetical protein
MRQGYLFDTKCCSMPLLLTAFGYIGQTESVTQKKNVRFVCVAHGRVSLSRTDIWSWRRPCSSMNSFRPSEDTFTAMRTVGYLRSWYRKDSGRVLVRLICWQKLTLINGLIGVKQQLKSIRR